MGKAGAQLVPGQDLACYCVDWVLRLWGCECSVAHVHLLVSEAGLKARAGWVGPGILWKGSVYWWVKLSPGVSECKALGVPVFVLALWCVGPGPGHFGGQDCVQWWLWAQGVLRHPGVSGVLKSPTIIVLPISFFMSLNICFIYIGGPV